MDRKDFLRQHAGLAGLAVLEIGALANPMVTRDDADVRYLDHMSTEGLHGKYAGDPAVDKDALVDVSYVWNGGPMSAAVTDGRRFDLIVASHVFEHFADPVGWLADVHGLLKPGGRIFLALPDKRFTFDLDRADTTLAQWVGWHLRRLQRPGVDQVLDYFLNVRTVSAASAWRGGDPESFPRIYDPGLALQLARSAADDYVDAHCSVFTPYGFVELCRGLAGLGLFPYRFAACQPTPVDELEFLVLLEATDETSVVQLDNAALQGLARQAGYAGEFGAGRFARAQEADPGLKQRYAALVDERRRSLAEERARRGRGFPDLAPALHHAPPATDDERLALPRRALARLRGLVAKR